MEMPLIDFRSSSGLIQRTAEEQIFQTDSLFHENLICTQPPLRGAVALTNVR